jgi:hypothetical protein
LFLFFSMCNKYFIIYNINKSIKVKKKINYNNFFFNILQSILLGNHYIYKYVY